MKFKKPFPSPVRTTCFQFYVRTTWTQLITEFLEQVGGWTQEYAGLTFVSVRGAGHEVPLHRPKLALTLIKAFLSGTSMPASELVSSY